jgi:serine phosphatase RsbU (regulator of sigma subunit)
VRLITVQNKIISVSVGFVLMIAPFLFYYFPQQQKDTLREGYEKEVRNIAVTVALGVNIALQGQSFEGVETSMQHAKSDPRLTFVALIQMDTVVDESGKSIIEKTEFSIFPEDYEFDIDQKSTDDIIISNAPIQSEFLSGDVIVGFSTESIKAEIAEFMLRSFIGSLCLSILAIVLGVILARSISKPINRLKGATQLVAEGDLSQSVIVKSKDEIGDLSKSFNSMVEKLEISESQLKLQKVLVEEKNQDLTDSIVYAKKIQMAILPPADALAKKFNDSFVLYMPKDIVSGDFYWMQTTKDRVLISVADCTGHGVPGAFVSLVSYNALNTSVREFGLAQPSTILDKTNVLMQDHFKTGADGKEIRDGMDIALCSIVKDNNLIEYAGAHNSLWIISSKTPKDNGVALEPNLTIGDIHLFEVRADRQPIGSYVEQKPFTNHKVDLHKGDFIYLFSDGYADQFGGERGKKFKAKAFKKILLENCNKPLEEQKKLLKSQIISWMGDTEQLDDICIIGIQI